MVVPIAGAAFVALTSYMTRARLALLPVLLSLTRLIVLHCGACLGSLRRGFKPPRAVPPSLPTDQLDRVDAKLTGGVR